MIVFVKTRYMKRTAPKIVFVGVWSLILSKTSSPFSWKVWKYHLPLGKYKKLRSTPLHRHNFWTNQRIYLVKIQDFFLTGYILSKIQVSILNSLYFTSKYGKSVIYAAKKLPMLILWFILCNFLTDCKYNLKTSKRHFKNLSKIFLKKCQRYLQGL